ncbi:hypothetical protein FSP39_002083 [Pinctada imbricata]|uniref:C2H2-type domain-containing protein n=1 Tax=Pinctada imbricata TaxID=66713 RepID=A0AA89BHK0_PINIB|nr:hypothetical protein FSP39_002083 [Pinctada imbricata]
MISTQVEDTDAFSFSSRPKRIRHDSGRHFNRDGVSEKTLDITGVVGLLKRYTGYDGGINCSVCGKLYKSRVCFIKHLWEHTIYWDQFTGVKNHDRVLSIQAALILYTTVHRSCTSEESIITELLVTAPNEKKEEITENSPCPRTPRKQSSPLKRKRSSESCSFSQ